MSAWSQGRALRFSTEHARVCAREFAKRGDDDAAARAYQAIWDADPSAVEIGLRLCIHTLRAGRPWAAGRIYLEIASLLARDGEVRDALVLARRAVDLAPLEALEDRLASFGFATGPLAVPLLCRCADAQLGLGRDHKALAILRLAAEIDPERVAAIERLVDLCFRLRLHQEAIDHIQSLAWRLLARGRTAEYIPIAERLLRYLPHDETTLRGLARVYVRSGRREKALDRLERLVRVAPRDHEALSAIAEIRAALRQPKAALAALARYAWARLRSGPDRKSEVAETLSRALAWCPDDRDYQRALLELSLSNLIEGASLRSKVPAPELLLPPPPPPFAVAMVELA